MKQTKHPMQPIYRDQHGNIFYTWGHFISGFTPRPLREDAPRVAYWPISAPLEDPDK